MTVAEAFAAFCIARGGPVDPGHPARRLHDLLVRGVLEAPAGPPCRRPSLCHDATPVVYSLKLRARGAEPLRLLVEPGGLAIPVSSQIDFSFGIVEQTLGMLGWRGAAADILDAASNILPADSGRADSLWGGVWLGGVIPRRAMASDATGVELRVYLNLRHGDEAERWERLRRLLGASPGAPVGVGQLDPQTVESPRFEEWIRHTAPRAVPVGVGLVLRNGSLAGARIYTGVRRPTRGVLAALAAIEPNSPIDHQLASFERRFGELPSQGATAAFDFARAPGNTFAPRWARAKVDLCCQHLPSECEPDLAGWARETAFRFGLDPSPLLGFDRDLTRCWNTWRSDFFSLGHDREGAFLTAYARPHYPPLARYLTPTRAPIPESPAA